MQKTEDDDDNDDDNDNGTRRRFIQSRVRMPQIEVRRDPTVGLATELCMNLLIPTPGKDVCSMASAGSDRSPKTSRNCNGFSSLS